LLDGTDGLNLNSKRPPDLGIASKHDQVDPPLYNFLKLNPGRILFVVETEGRRQMILEMLKGHDVRPTGFDTWKDFTTSSTKLGIAIATLDDGIILTNPDIALITESQLFGERVQQRRRRKAANKDNDAIIKNLTELSIGSPVVHQDLGVGRYVGLQKLTVGGFESEFLALEYADNDKLYVPVSSLHLISRYTGSSPEKAPLNKLGTDQWERAKKKATERIHDVAAELLEVFAQREAARGHVFKINHDEYMKFSNDFPFEETPDQETAIQSVYDDMQKERPMDRVVCGDVGFGKTEVAMRAAFIAANDNKQVAVLVPTTLLAQQHYQNFCDRFSDWPFRIEVLSRFKSKKQTDEAIADLKNGKIDIVIGTHKLLSDNIKYKDIGLMIVDEEHRFGVRQKEKIKAFSANVDLLTLTATPIPRTLNMSLAGLRDLSIISTPPEHRLAVKTFVSQWDDVTLREACQREIKRGGQVYFLHNDVSSMERIAREISELVPEAEVEIAHGQMPEKQLEQIMFDFYHRRFNVLVCSTIVESGIDVPTANTIIINRADKLGLAQLHQLRGRVGRSHHRAYAYLFVPPQNLMTEDAKKRIDAIESLEELGAGFMIASHDLEIRGAGELLGEEQSGQIHAIGFSLYSEMLEKAVAALKRGEQPQLDRPLDHGAEVDMQVPALIPEDYLPDVHSRLTLYKRIASTENEEQLRELQVEMIDRFGLLPDPLKNLIRVTELKLMANPLGIEKIDMYAKGGRITFNEQPNINPMKIIGLIQKQPAIYKLDGQTKLRIIKNLETPEERFETIESLLKSFSE
ncbi:MAG: transcription-repair coupling factor, partial [Gammaproteobacteria bacterium]|nr:transcription-repair coupling factor [Gammaproteobacteria bacterium]